jgi:hypothetical protein
VELREASELTKLSINKTLANVLRNVNTHLGGHSFKGTVPSWVMLTSLFGIIRGYALVNVAMGSGLDPRIEGGCSRAARAM